MRGVVVLMLVLAMICFTCHAKPLVWPYVERAFEYQSPVVERGVSRQGQPDKEDTLGALENHPLDMERGRGVSRQGQPDEEDNLA